MSLTSKFINPKICLQGDREFAESVRDWPGIPRFSHELIDQSGLQPEEVEGELKARLLTGIFIYSWGDAWRPDYSRNVELTLGRPIHSELLWLRVLGCLDLDAMPRLTLPVGSLPLGASPYGAHDMGGNVWEWRRDSHRKHYDAAATRNPAGPPATPYKVLRGGAWSSHRGKLRAAYRNYDLRTDRHVEIGFRCVK